MTGEDGLRLRLDIMYDGTAFAGWARQPGQRTVAGVITESLAVLLRSEVRIVVAGRTDSGVHAVAQVAHIDVTRDALYRLAPRHLLEFDPGEAALIGLRRRLAGLLPADVRIPGVAVAADGFDARFSALRRHYRYRIMVSDWGVPPLGRFDVITWRRPLDTEAMAAAAGPLVGLHDFAAYCKPREGATTIRDLQLLDLAARDREDSAGAREVTIDVTADAFCHSMVRSLVGALIAVGEGRAPITRPAELLRAGQRTSEVSVAAAAGLTLMGVDYPKDAELAARAEATRAVRVKPFDCEGDGPSLD